MAARQSRGLYLNATFVLTVAKVKRDRNRGKASKAQSCKVFSSAKRDLPLGVPYNKNGVVSILNTDESVEIEQNPA